jgi:flagellar L-ring protein precursor FlgH
MDLRDVRNPQTSDLIVNSQTIPEVNRISVPMPPVAVAPPPQRAESASIWGRENKGFFRDRRAKQVGDLVTVLIDIDDGAQLRNATERSREASQTVKEPDFLGLNSRAGNAIDLESSSERSGEGSIRRNETISLRVAALLIQELPNGNFVIGGRQEVKVNQELRELRIAGIIRQADINANNTLDYEKIAEARITYGGRGQISAVQTARYGHDTLEVILPY